MPSRPADILAPIPLTIVGGQRDAGASALIRHLLAHADDRRVAALVPRIAPYVGRGGTVRADGLVCWSNGCFAHECGELSRTLAEVAARERPHHILLESDPSSPRPRAGYGAAAAGLRFDGTVSVVDARLGLHGDASLLTESELAQLAAADLVVLNHAKAAGARAASTTQYLLGSIARGARFLWCADAAVSPDLILGPASDPTRHASITTAWRQDFIPARDTRGQQMLADASLAWWLESGDGVLVTEFRHWVAQLPPAVVRGSGSVLLRELPRHRHEFTLVGQRWSLARRAPWGTTPPGTRIALVSINGTEVIQ